MYKNLNFDALGIVGHQSELIELTLSHGFRGFDLDLADFARQVEQKGLDHAKRLIASAKLKLGSFELPLDWDGDEEDFQRDLAALPERAQLAAEVGCKLARITVPPANDFRPYHECFELYRRRFREIGEKLAPLEMRLGVGFVATAREREGRAYQFVHSFDALLLLVKSVGARNVGVCLDIWHWHISGGTLDQIEALDPGDVVTVDVADATTLAGDDNVEDTTRTLPGKGPAEGGIIDVPAILAVLAKMGFDGPVTPKPHPQCFEGLKRDEIVKQCGTAMNDLWAAANLSKHGKLVSSA